MEALERRMDCTLRAPGASRFVGDASPAPAGPRLAEPGAGRARTADEWDPVSVTQAEPAGREA